MATKTRRSRVPRQSLQEAGIPRPQARQAPQRERRGALEAPGAAGTAGANPTDTAQDHEAEPGWPATSDTSHGMQAKVDEALARLAAGRYSWCEECKAPIPAARLRALPFTVRCLACQERALGM